MTNKLVHEKKKYNIEYYLSAEDATEEDDVWIGLFKLLLEILQYDRYSFNTRFRLVISILGVIDNIKADEDKVKEFVKLFEDKQIFIQQMNVNDLKDSQIQKYMLFLCRSFADNIKVSNCGNLYIYKYIAEYLFSLDVDNINGEVKAKTQSMNRYEYIFEKYMCAFIHRHFFPMVVLNDFMTKIRVMVYSYNFYRLVCFAMLEKKEFSLDGFAEVIYSMDRDFEHTYASGLAELGLFNPNASIEDLLGLI